MPATTLSPQKLYTLIRATVREELRELLNDPDFGLPLKASTAQRLAHSLRAKKTGQVRSAEEVISRLGLRV